ncbi:4-amino-5-hydroxymethyl-2-methylpyrimidine phosphate synthase [Metarhizium anisopliae]
MSTDKITFLANWHATPYHAPLYLAQAKGYFKDEGIKVALLEPNDPSDVTEIIGTGKVDLGFKAMIHTLAAKARNFPVLSIGSLLDEPFTGVVYLKDSGITTDFRSLKGKRIGYVGEFGKIQIDELTSHYGLTPADYTAVRCGMNVSKAIINGDIDAGIGLENATDFVLADPHQAWKEYVDFKPVMNSQLNWKIFERSYAYFSQDLKNVERDWDKVTKYGQRLGVLSPDFKPNYTNEFLGWGLEPDSTDPTGDQKRMVELQRNVACCGGFHRLPLTAKA